MGPHARLCPSSQAVLPLLGSPYLHFIWLCSSSSALGHRSFWILAGVGNPVYLSVADPHRHTGPLLELLEAEILHPDSEAPSGVKSHFLDIFLEELTRVGADEVGCRPRGSWFWLWLWGSWESV